MYLITNQYSLIILSSCELQFKFLFLFDNLLHMVLKNGFIFATVVNIEKFKNL